MRLTRIQIDGFGVLRGTDLRFGRAMNLIVGPNEAGKSTLQEAILAGLYGLHADRQRSRAALLESADHWRPWQGGPFGVGLELALEDGAQMRIERDLDAGTVRVIDLLTADDITDRFERDRWGALQIGRRLLGVTREIYSNTACISRSEVMRLEDAGSIKEAIASLADSAHPDRSAQQVLDRLRQERLERIGRARARSGPLRDLEAKLTELERQLAAARRARAAVEEFAEKREAVAARTEAELTTVQTLEAAVLGSRLEEARRRLERTRELQQAIREEEEKQQAHAAYAGFPIELDSQVQELRAHQRATREALRDFERWADEVAGQLKDLEAERERLDVQLQRHENQARGIDELALQQEPLVRDMVSTLTYADAEAPELHLRSSAAAEEVARIAERQPGLIGPNVDWTARQIAFQRVYSEWRERHTVAMEARNRAGVALPPRLEQLKHDITRYKDVPQVIKAGQEAEEAMRHEEAMAERARGRRKVFLGAMLGGLLLTALAILVAFLAFQGGGSIWLVGTAFSLLGMGVLATAIAIWVNAAARREVERRLKAKDEARTRRREILGAWRVRSSGELQQALVEHLQKVRYDATRLELDRQATELEERAQSAARSLRELVGSWDLPQPAPTDDALEQTAQPIDLLAQDGLAWTAASQRAKDAFSTEAALDERREQVRQRLHSALDRVGFDRHDALAAGHDFSMACEEARAAQPVRMRIEQIDAQLEQLRQPAARARAEQAKGNKHERQLSALYGPAGIADADPEAADRAWDAGLANAEAYRSSRARLDDLRKQLGTVAGHPVSESLEQLVHDLEGQLDQTVHGLDPRRVDEYRARPLAELERERDRHRSAKERAMEERARAEELLNDRLTQIGDVASLEEEITTTRDQLQELEAEAHAYDLAIETLESAARSVRRAVIPRLKSQLQGQLAPITNGRYREVQVGDDLAIQVRTQERTFRDVDKLSLGTRSLIYLLERVALARIIGGNAEPPPLLLDEALVHADRRRMRAALDELGRLGHDHQVIVFSKDETLADRAERAENWTVIHLPEPSLVGGGMEAAPSPELSGEPAQAEAPEVSTV